MSISVILRRASDSAVVRARFKDHGLVGSPYPSDKMPLTHKSTFTLDDGQEIVSEFSVSEAARATNVEQARYTVDLANLSAAGYEVIEVVYD